MSILFLSLIALRFHDLTVIRRDLRQCQMPKLHHLVSAPFSCFIDSVALNIGLRLSFGTRTLLHRVHLFLGLNFSSRVKIASLTNKIIHNDMVDEMLRSRTTTLHAETNVVEWH